MEGETEVLMRPGFGLCPRAYRRYLFCVFLLMFTEKFISALIELPTIRLFEAAVCREYYQVHTVSNTDDNTQYSCNIASIQDDVAMLIGIKAALDTMPGTAHYRYLPNLIIIQLDSQVLQHHYGMVH